MTINITVPHDDNEMKPRIVVIGVGGAGCNAVNNMIRSNLEGVEFVSTNTDAQALKQSLADRRMQLGTEVTRGLGAGSRPDVGKAAAEESIDAIIEHLGDSNMCFITAGMGGGTGTGAAPVIAQTARERGILTVGVVTKPFHFEGQHRMRIAEAGIEELTQYVDTLIIIPNQNLFRIANEKTTFADAFNMADDVLHSGVRGVTDLMIMPGLINLDFADIRTVMSEMGKAMMGTGEASGEKRAIDAAEAAINNPLLEDTTMKGAKGVLINITGGFDMTLFEVDEAANRIREEVDPDANIIFGSTFDEKMDGMMRVSVVATGIAAEGMAAKPRPQLSLVRAQAQQRIADRPAAAEAPASAMPITAQQPAIQQPSAPQPAAQHSVPATAVSAMSTMDISRQAASGIGELSMPEVPSMAETDGSLAFDLTEEMMEAPAGEEPVQPTVDEKPFIAPAAQVPPRRPETAPRAADAFRASDLVNAAPTAEPKAEPARGRGPSLFRQITGLGLGKADKPEPTHAEAPRQPAAQPAGQPVQPRLGALNPSDRVRPSQSEDETLDIPAFLRRQAN
ncbi:cell division protein FtsZ [Thalassobaculum fulvum]|uniref:Cell division protein FtsZ n=1 Tax=Thalassobaculum fulvum TaxID=1633335 RepID=A0A918XT26_9PROT|nr:cell division protein FtsZ [Thalassobaculum fulvum]GHD54043.1 cell division protein FtsZ [Thalassobaculum fulvum]